MSQKYILSEFYDILAATLPPSQRKPLLKTDHIVDYVSAHSGRKSKSKFEMHFSLDGANASVDAYADLAVNLFPPHMLPCAAEFLMRWNGSTTNLFAAFQQLHGDTWLLFRYIFETAGLEQDMNTYITARFAAAGVINIMLPGLVEEILSACK